MKILYMIIFAFVLVGCSTSTNSDEQEVQKEEEIIVKDDIINTPIIELERELLGSWTLLLKQSDTSKFEIINPCNGSAGSMDFSSEVSIASGQEAMVFNLVNFTKGKIQVVGTDKQEHSISYQLTDDANYLNIIPENDFPNSNLFGNFERASFDSLLDNTSTRDTLHFIKRPDNWREFIDEQGINMVFLPCDEDMFDEE